MPSPESILTSLTSVANDWRSLAILWHGVLAVVLAALALGWQPPSRWFAWMLAAPLMSVSVLAWLSFNPFNGTLFATLSALLVAASDRLSSARFERASPAFVVPGMLLVAFGWIYPHFLQTDSWTAYAYAAPVGLLPCPTLALVAGLSLTFGLAHSRSWGLSLAAASLLYGAFGVFRLGVSLDWVLLAGATVVIVALLREPLLWRSVRAYSGEQTRPLPGDELITRPLAELTHAVTVRGATPDDIWPWLVQMGAGTRAGWYSYDLLDNGGRPSATHIVPALQHIDVGTVFPAAPGMADGFVVVSFQPAKSLVLGWRAPDGGWAVTWAFTLAPMSETSTRLVARVRGASEYRFHGLPPVLSRPVIRAVHFVMQRRQLLGIAGRVETACRARQQRTGDALLDRFMPEYDVVERHHIHIDAPAAAAFAAACEQDLQSAPAIRAIFRAREILLRAAPDAVSLPRPLIKQVKALGWGVLAETPGREIVMGAVTQPWESNVTFRALPAERFAGYQDRGCVKIAWTLRVDPDGPDACTFSTETRAMATDAVARTRFLRYWAVVSPGVALIRRLSLRPLKRDAERRAHMPAAA